MEAFSHISGVYAFRRTQSMKTKNITIIVSIFIFMGFVGCSDYHKVTGRERKRVDNVKRVLMHESNRYTLLVQKQNNVLEEIYLILELGQVKIITDVPEGKDMWAEWDEVDYDGIQMKNGKFSENVVIHIHSAKDINGGGWSRRRAKKQIHGQTIVVE